VKLETFVKLDERRGLWQSNLELGAVHELYMRQVTSYGQKGPGLRMIPWSEGERKERERRDVK